MSRNVLFTMMIGGLLGGGLIGGGILAGCGEGEGEGDGSSGAGGVEQQWYPGTCVRTDEDNYCDFPPCKGSRTYTYDGEGKLVAYTYDRGADGTTDYKVTFAYNADGTRTEHHDTDADGTVDDTWTRDANPKSWEEKLEAVCRQSPGQRVDIDTGSSGGGGGSGDGGDPRNDVDVLVCDTSGRPMKLEDGRVSGRVTTYTYDSKGRLLRSERTGEYPSVVTYTYDSKGRLLRKEETGDDPYVTTYTYEPNGTGWTKEYDGSTDGDVYLRVTCTCGECDWNHEH